MDTTTLTDDTTQNVAIEQAARLMAQAFRLLQPADIPAALIEMNKMLGEGDRNVTRHICVTCAEEFELSGDTREWFITKGLSLPKRCKACRRERGGK